MKKLVLAAAFVLCASSAFAQTPAVPNRLSLLVIPATGDPLTVAPVASSTINIPSAACDLAPVVAAPSPYVNPRVARVNDPLNAGRDCEFLFPTTLTNGNYRITAVATSDSCVISPNPALVTCDGPRTAVTVPFSVVLSALLSALTGLRITQ